jgi:hypothetical protein
LPPVLRLGLSGLSVPVLPGPHGELYLGPGAPRPGRTLRRLVLAPLFTRIRTGRGRLYPDQSGPFRLIVEFSGPSRDTGTLLRAYRRLDQQLRDHAPMLTRCRDGRMEPGPVTVVIAGIVDVRELLAAQPTRYAFAAGSFDDVGSRSAPPTLVPMVAEPWSRRFGWDGREPIPAEERHLLHGLVREAHADGRTVCVSGLSIGSGATRRAIWTELDAAGVDLIADTDLSGLARHERHRPASPPAPMTVRRPSPRPHPQRDRSPIDH